MRPRLGVLALASSVLAATAHAQSPGAPAPPVASSAALQPEGRSRWVAHTLVLIRAEVKVATSHARRAASPAAVKASLLYHIMPVDELNGIDANRPSDRL